MDRMVETTWEVSMAVGVDGSLDSCVLLQLEQVLPLPTRLDDPFPRRVIDVVR